MGLRQVAVVDFVSKTVKLVTPWNSWNADIRLVCQEISRHLVNAKGWYRVHKNPHDETSYSIKVGHCRQSELQSTCEGIICSMEIISLLYISLVTSFCLLIGYLAN
jgi:hypothetical protein